MATATLNQVRTNLVNGYQIENSITAPVDIPAELFVYDELTSEFSHVATLTDFAYPDVNTPGTPYYRQSTATKLYTDVESALEFANHVKFRVDTLLKSYTTDQDDFPGTFNFPLPEVP